MKGEFNERINILIKIRIIKSYSKINLIIKLNKYEF